MNAKAVFERHNAEVKAAIPAERLLVFEAKDLGWRCGAALITLLMQAGLPLLAALLLVIGINGLAIAVAVASIRGLLPRLGLPATPAPPDLVARSPHPSFFHRDAQQMNAPLSPAAGQPVAH